MIRTVAAALLATLSLSAPTGATTIDPTNFDMILTEGRRITTVDGADVSGNAATPGNGDIVSHTVTSVPEDSSTLLVGRLIAAGGDSWFFNNVTGHLSLDVLNYTEAFNAGLDPFNAEFKLFVNGTQVERLRLFGDPGQSFAASFSVRRLTGDDVELRISSTEGASDYDINFSVTSVPLPASAALLILGIAGLGALKRRAL